jgi:hypothetical protein
MLQAVNPTDPLTAARLVEFLAPNTHWHRSLWNIGMVLTLRELIEAAQAMRSGVLSDEFVKALGNAAIRLAGKDPAVSEIQRTVLRNCLLHPPRYDGLDYHSLVQISEQIEKEYLSRWAAALRNITPPINPERAARCIASYLLDRGFSATWPHEWWKHRLFGNQSEVVLAEAVAEDHDELGRHALKEFEVLIAFKRSPGSQSGYPPEWLKANATVEWLREYGSDTSILALVSGSKANEPRSVSFSTRSIVLRCVRFKACVSSI